MATNDELDDFFKKKDRKGNKHKKQSGLLTNNQALLKQLEIVTSATSAFKENLDFYDEDDETTQVIDEPILGAAVSDEVRKHPPKSTKTKIIDPTNISNEQQIVNPDEGQQQDEWEDFQSSNYNYEQLRLKFAAGNNDNDDEYYDEENHPDNNDHNNESTGDQQQQKDRPVWKMDQTKKTAETYLSVVAETPQEEQQRAPPKPATSTGAYIPPALRTGSSVTVVSGNPQRAPKKKQPNLASTDEFPTLKSTVNKK